MADEVAFKAYLLKDGVEKSEIRRFSLDQNVATSFLYLKEKLRVTFPPTSLAQNFEVFWKDHEGDIIAIASDEELTIALTELKNEDIFKIYVKNREVPSASANPRGPEHEGVVCDGCERNISGFRYKCLGCHNFDLCGGCEAKGVHSEHFILRIPSPLNLRHHFGHRLINKISKAAKRAESRCPWSHRSGYNYENFNEEFTNNCSTEESARPTPSFSRNNSRRHSKSNEEGKPEGCIDPKECNKKCGGASANFEAPGSSATASIKIDPTQIINTLVDFGIDLSQFFAPQFGDPKDDNKGSQTAKKSQSEQTANKNESSTAKIPKMSTNENAPTASSTAGTSTPGSSSAPVAPEPQNGSSLLDDWTVYNPNENQDVPMTESTTTQPIEIDLEEQIQNAIRSEDKNEPSTSTTGNIYPSLTQQPKNKKVADALDQMLAMGFKNDDGWLTNLLNYQDGNIEKVLDLIQPAAIKKTKN